MKGLTASSEETVALNDSSLSGKSGTSDVINVGYTAKGVFNKHAEVLTPEELKTVMKYSDYMAKERAGKILEGEIAIHPTAKGSCEYCEFRASCSFDRKIPGYEKRTLGKMNKDEMIQKMNEKMKEPAESGH